MITYTWRCWNCFHDWQSEHSVDSICELCGEEGVYTGDGNLLGPLPSQQFKTLTGGMKDI